MTSINVAPAEIQSLYHTYEKWDYEACPFDPIGLPLQVKQLLSINQPQLLNLEWFWFKRNSINPTTCNYWISKDSTVIKLYTTLYTRELSLTNLTGENKELLAWYDYLEKCAKKV